MAEAGANVYDLRVKARLILCAEIGDTELLGSLFKAQKLRAHASAGGVGRSSQIS